VSRRRHPPRVEPRQAVLFDGLADSSTPKDLPVSGTDARASAQSPPETMEPQITPASAPPGASSEPPPADAERTPRAIEQPPADVTRAQRILAALRKQLEILRRLDVKRKEPPTEAGAVPTPARPRGPARPPEQPRRETSSPAVGSRGSDPSPDGSMGAAGSHPEPHAEAT